MARDHYTYDFKSVGDANDEYEKRVEFEEVIRPIGIMTPIRLSQKSDSVFEMHDDILMVIRDNLKNLIMTNHGERLMLPDYGANLRSVLFDLGTSEGADSKVMRKIVSAVEKYMPFVELGGFTPLRKVSPTGNINKLAALLTFSVPSINAENIGLEVVLYEGG